MRDIIKRFRKEEGECAGNAPSVASDTPSEERPRRVLCSRSRSHVADASEAIEMAGRHQHTCVNPAGITFRIRCFARAPGCVAHGEKSDFFSWFADHAWQIALCKQCRGHLGWFFHGSDSAFVGLIANRIEEAEG